MLTQAASLGELALGVDASLHARDKEARRSRALRAAATAALHVDPDGPELDGHSFVRAEQCIAVLQRRLLRPLSKGGPKSELTLTQYHLLSFLAARGRASVTEIRGVLGVAQSSASVLVDKLARAGLIEKRRDRADHRVTIVVALPKGLRLVQRYRKNAERNVQVLVRFAGENAARDLFDALERAIVAVTLLDELSRTKRLPPCDSASGRRRGKATGRGTVAAQLE